MDRLPYFACGAAPFAFASLVGLARTLQSAGSARGWVARFGGGVAILEIAIGVLAGAALVSWLARRDRRLAAAAVAAGLGSGLATLVLLADGLPPLARASAPAAIAIAAVAAAIGAGARRFAGGDPEPAAAIATPLAIVLGASGSRFVQGALDIDPGSAAGLGVLGAVLAGCVATAHAIERLPMWRRPAVATAAIAAALGVPALAAGGAVALGRPIDAALPAGSVAGAPDVLLVVLDTLRADHGPAAPGASFPTPTLERLAREGARYTSMFSTSCWTLPSHVSLFTGLSPLDHGSGWERGGLRAELPTLAERLRDAGWRTAGFSANPWVSRELGLDRGFESFVEADVSRAPRPAWPVRFFPAMFARAEGALVFEDKRGRQLTSELLRWLARGEGRPSFAFLNVMEPHLPYDPPRRYDDDLAGDGWTVEALEAISQDRLEDLDPRRSRTAREIEGLRRLYGAEAAYADALLGRVVAALERAERLDRTVVVVVSDHGESVGEHPPLDHQLGLWDSLVRVPAIVRFPPAVPAGSIRRDLATLEDVPAWIERLAGLAPTFPGGAWNHTARPHAIAAYDRPGPILEQIRSRGLDPAPWDRALYMLRTPERKWIFGSDGHHAAFDLVADPAERRDLIVDGRPPEGFRPLEEGLAAILAARAAPGAPATAPRLDDDTLRRLRSLGYVR